MKGIEFMSCHEDNNIRRWSMNPDSKEMTLEHLYSGHSNAVRNVGLSPSESRFVSCCEDHSLRVWDSEEMEDRFLLAGHTNIVVASEFIDETHLISASWDMTIGIWEVPDTYDDFYALKSTV